MRSLLCALLLGSALFAQDNAAVGSISPVIEGRFYVDGIVYQYASARDYTVVAAVHSVLNHKFLAVKVRIYNTSQRSITVKPEDVVLEDAIAGQGVAAISAAELAKRLRKPYNMARFGATMGGADPSDTPITSDMLSPQFLQMMRAMAARANGGGGMPGGSNVLYTDTPGALDADGQPARSPDCDQVCRLRTRESQTADPLAQLQHQTAPDTVEQYGLLANTIPPHGNVAGVLYYPLGKLTQAVVVPAAGKKSRLVEVTVPVEGESFQFLLPVE